MTRSGRASRAALATACVLALGGCSEEEAEEVLRTSGPLADGFEIEPGSALIGAVFPSYGGGLQAILRVDGEMEKVFEGYVRQAEELGYPVESSLGRAEGQWCNDDPDLWNHYRNGDDRFEVECAARASEVNQFSMSLSGLAQPDGGGYIEISGGMQSEVSASIPSVPDGPTASVTDVELAPDLAPMYDDPPIRVVEGSALLFDPFPSRCTTGGYVAVLQVTDELAPVMRGYLEQFDAARFSGPGLVGDADALFIDMGISGGGGVSGIGVAGDPSYILIQRCND